MPGDRNPAPLNKNQTFNEIKPTSNLYRPDVERFLEYSRVFYKNRRYTNDGTLSLLLQSRLEHFHEVDRVVAVTSGFWALLLTLSALALQNRNEIVVPSLSYRRTDDIIAWAGFTPHFCDVDEVTLSPTVEHIKTAVNENTALILVPHPMVNCCDASGIETLGRTLGIPVVFDSVEAAYRVCDNRRVGSFGDAEIFSMHASKLLNSYEGGYITTNNIRLAERLDDSKRFGFIAEDTVRDGHALNAKLNEMHAAMGLASLDEIDEQVSAHRRKYDLYHSAISEIDGINLIEHKLAERSDYRVIVVRLSDSWPLSKTDTIRLLHSQNILVRPYYSPPLHMKAVPYSRVTPALPSTERVCEELLVLPSGSHVSEQDVEIIVAALLRLGRTGSEYV